MKVVLVNLPAYVPSVMPYSLASLQAELFNHIDEEVDVVDLNSFFHFEYFKEYYSRLRSGKGEYFTLLEEFMKRSREVYTGISTSVVCGEKVLLEDEMMEKILALKPKVVGFSVSYNIQVFFLKGIAARLRDLGIDVVLGGPADYSAVMEGCVSLGSGKAFAQYLLEKGAKKKENVEKNVIDFSHFAREEYFTCDVVYPLRTARSCPYKRCAFCTHHGGLKYVGFDLAEVEKAVVLNRMSKVFIIDDDIPLKRLLALGEIMKKHGVEWWCQLRPLSMLKDHLAYLYTCGLRCVAWGVESGCQRVLDLIEKGTKTQDVCAVLSEAKREGIVNMVYVMFGFPGESENEAEETVTFLESLRESIDLVSTSVFGLQHGSRVLADPSLFGVDEVSFEKRTVLPEKISYTVSSGMSQKKAKAFSKKNLKRVRRLNKLPGIVVWCKSEVLNVEKEKN